MAYRVECSEPVFCVRPGGCFLHYDPDDLSFKFPCDGCQWVSGDPDLFPSVSDRDDLT